MTVGIVSYGAYVPYYRMDRKEIGKAWQKGGGAGEKAVANYDEDSITMGVAAAINCLADMDRSEVDRFYLATTTPMYKEKQNAALAAFALDLPRQAITADFSGSVRCSTIALRAALDAVEGGLAKKALVATADCRLGMPQSDTELNSGDGSASFLIGSEGVAVAVEGYYSHHDEIIDWWQTKDDTFMHTWESRYMLDEGYVRNVKEAVSIALQKYSLTPQDFSKLILYAPDPRSHGTMAATLKFDPKTQLQDPLFNVVGNSGSAFTLMMLAAALEQAKPGDKLLMVNYSSGCDVFILRVTEEIEKLRKRRGVSYHVGIKAALPSYERYLQFRGITLVEPPRRPLESSFAPGIWRDRDQILAFKAQKCRKCGTTVYPKQRVCYTCKTKDEFDLVCLSDKKGTVFSYVVDNLAATPHPPAVCAVVEMEGGCRTFMELVECDPATVKLDMLVDPTFRQHFITAGYPNYCWKCRPIREV